MKYKEITIAFSDIPGLTSLNIYTTGCIHNCKGCHLYDLQDINAGKEMPMDPLPIEYIDLVNSIIWMGGDPFYQPEELKKFATMYRQEHPNLIHACFTGYKYEDLDPEITKLFDIIIDGKWEGIPYNEKGTNQRIFYKGKVVSFEELKQLTK